MKKWYKEDNESIPALIFSDIQPSGYSEITDENELKKIIMSQYKDREEDGKIFYNDFRTRLYMSILNGTYTSQQAFDVEDYLKDLKDNLITGNWLTAQFINSNLPFSGIYDQTLKDEIQSGIDNYVNNNY